MEQFSATFACPPESGLVYQISVSSELALAEQAASRAETDTRAADVARARIEVERARAMRPSLLVSGLPHM
ncbi:hypothetical protein GCM10027062_27630 [Nocardioides hungaricus]